MGHPSRTSLSLVVIAAVVLVACGSDDPEPAASAPATTAAAPSATATPSTTAAPSATATPATDAATTDAATTDASTTDSGAAAPGDMYGGYPTGDGSGTTATTVGSTSPPAAGTEALVEIADSDLGRILATQGMTLYIFTPDEGEPAPTCAGGCADAWPPLLADGDVPVGDGLDQTRFATVARDDGGTQVTFDGWPLYTFASDAAPGDVNGQGASDKWYVIGPDGTVVRD